MLGCYIARNHYGTEVLMAVIVEYCFERPCGRNLSAAVEYWLLFHITVIILYASVMLRRFCGRYVNELLLIKFILKNKT